MSKGIDIWLIKDDIGHFHPLNDIDREKAAKIPTMEENCFTIKRIRNPKFHRKYFKLLQLVFENQDKYSDFEHFRQIMQMKAGYFDCVVTDKGEVYLPRSIAYDAMDETQFSELYEKVAVVLQGFIKISRDELESEISRMI